MNSLKVATEFCILNNVLYLESREKLLNVKWATSARETTVMA